MTYAIFHTVGDASIEDCYAPQSQPHKACSCIFHRNGIQDNDPASCSGLFIQQPAGKPSQASGPRKCEQLDSMNSVTGYSDMKMLYTVQQGMLPEENLIVQIMDK